MRDTAIIGAAQDKFRGGELRWAAAQLSVCKRVGLRAHGTAGFFSLNASSLAKRARFQRDKRA